MAKILRFDKLKFMCYNTSNDFEIRKFETERKVLKMANVFENIDFIGTAVDPLILNLKSRLEGKEEIDCVVLSVSLVRHIIRMLEKLNEYQVKSDATTLEGAIKHLSESLNDPLKDWGCAECKKEHEDLFEFLKELKAYRESGLSASEVFNLSRNNSKELERLRELFKKQTGEVERLRGELDEKTRSREG